MTLDQSPDLLTIDPTPAPPLEMARRDYEAAQELVADMLADGVSTESQILFAMKKRYQCKEHLAELESQAMRRDGR